jgi:hypothetical protein
MTKILHLTLRREPFDEIASGKKRTEWRKRTKYWRTRLEGKTFDLIKFRNAIVFQLPPQEIAVLACPCCARSRARWQRS